MSTILAYLTLCIVWGTTFLAIKVALEGFDPFFMAGSRFLMAAILLVPVFFRKTARFPKTKRETGAVVLSGILMLTGGNGLVTLSEVYLDSGLAALTIAIGPAFTALIGGWFFAKDERYGKYAIVGTLMAMAGVIVLHYERLDFHHAELPGVIAAMAAPPFWSIGSLIARTRVRHADVLTSTALQMFAASVMFFAISLMLGESWRPQLTTRVVTSWLFLVVVGSSFVYAVYVWLLKRMPASRVITYTYINPIIALIVGNLILSEPISAEIFPAAALILGGLAIIYFMKRRDERAVAASTPRVQEG